MRELRRHPATGSEPRRPVRSAKSRSHKGAHCTVPLVEHSRSERLGENEEQVGGCRGLGEGEEGSWLWL